MKLNMDLEQKLLQEIKIKIEDRVNKNIIKFANTSLNSEIFDAIEYSAVKTGGKRIRPTLFILLSRALLCKKITQSEESILLDIASAIEVMHSYSIVHDDLPAIDNDDYRRGKLTIHKKFGEDIAILSGDALLTMCFEILSNSKLSSSKKIESIKMFSSLCGAKGMILGQVMDIKHSEINYSSKIDLFLMMQRLKTSNMFILTTKLAGLSYGANKHLTNKLQQLGAHIGLILQMKDDLEDSNKEEANITKIIGIEETKVKIRESYLIAKKTIDDIQKNTKLDEYYINGVFYILSKMLQSADCKTE